MPAHNFTKCKLCQKRCSKSSDNSTISYSAPNAAGEADNLEKLLLKNLKTAYLFIPSNAPFLTFRLCVFNCSTYFTSIRIVCGI